MLILSTYMPGKLIKNARFSGLANSQSVARLWVRWQAKQAQIEDCEE
jgi:hypothetical protein